MQQCVLVTGAAGYIGRALCEELLARGHRVRAAVRSGSVAPAGAEPCSFALEDFAAGSARHALFDGVHTVFHLAGVAHRGAPAAEQLRLNCSAALALAAQADAAGVKHFVYLSSVYAALCNDAAGVRTAGGYAWSKYLAERGLLAAESNWRMRLTIVRSALVYGGVPKGRLATLLALARRGWLPQLPAIGNTPMIGLADLVRALLLLGFHPTISGNVLGVTDAERYSLDRIARALRSVAGRRQGVSFIPAGFLGALIACIAPLERLPMIGSRLALPRGLHHWDIGPDPRLAALGWAPALTLESALAAGTVAPVTTS